MTNVIETEIIKGIILFAEKNNITLNETQIDDIKEKTTHRRRIILYKDTFLLVCKYLPFWSIIDFITTCKEFMNYYPYIWVNIIENLFPYSILPTKNYKDIRYALVVDFWHEKKRTNNNFEDDSETFNDILDDDDNIRKRYNDILQVYGNNRIIRTHKAEIRATKKNRSKSINCLYDEYIYLLEILKFYCETDPVGDKYAIIDSDVDMRIYGFDPSDTYDVNEWNNIGKKWITGEYHNSEIWIDINDYNMDDNFEYGTNANGYYKVRIPPYYFL